MNAINRPRGRPRIQSVSFRVFFRLLLFEAALRIALPTSRAQMPPDELAALWRRSEGHAVSMATRILVRFPDRRWAL